jgi:hypothetical protein
MSDTNKIIYHLEQSLAEKEKQLEDANKRIAKYKRFAELVLINSPDKSKYHRFYEDCELETLNKGKAK